MGDKEYISRVGRSPDRFEPPEPLLFGRDPGVRDPRWDGDMNVKRLRDGVLGVDGGTEVRVDERGGVRGGSIIVVFADNSSPNISFLMRALYILSASSSSYELDNILANVLVPLPRWASISLALCFLRGFDGDVLELSSRLKLACKSTPSRFGMNLATQVNNIPCSEWGDETCLHRSFSSSVL